MVIKSKVELDVVAVYTAAGNNGQVETLHIEHVSQRHVSTQPYKGCPDLIVENIERPKWDNQNSRSEIRATIKNIGDAFALPSMSQVIDLSPGGRLLLKLRFPFQDLRQGIRHLLPSICRTRCTTLTPI